MINHSFASEIINSSDIGTQFQISFVLQNMKIGFNRANSRYLRRISRTLHYHSVRPNETNTRQKTDPIQFYKQFCLQQKKNNKRRYCNFQ